MAVGELVVASYPDAIEAVRGIDSIEQLEDVIASSRLGDLQDRFTQSCENLEAVATANDIEVDLHCGSDES